MAAGDHKMQLAATPAINLYVLTVYDNSPIQLIGLKSELFSLAIKWDR